MEDAPPTSAATARALLARMVDNGLETAQEELDAVFQHLMATYVEAGSG